MNAHAAIGFCLECKANVPLKPATLTFGMLCENCGSNRIERQKAEPVPANPPSSGVSDAPGCGCKVRLMATLPTYNRHCSKCGKGVVLGTICECGMASPGEDYVPANPPSSGVSDAPGCGCKVEMRSAKDSMCRIDFIIVRCPLHEAAPDLYAALDKLTALLLKPISAQSTAVQLAHVELIERGCEDAQSAVAKARGEKPNETR